MNQTPDFTISRGDNPNIVIQFTISGVPAPLTGLTLTMSAKGDLGINTTPIFSYQATNVNAASGIASVQLQPADTTVTPGYYNYDLKAVDTSNNVFHRQVGVFEILPVVTV